MPPKTIQDYKELAKKILAPNVTYIDPKFKEVASWAEELLNAFWVEQQKDLDAFIDTLHQELQKARVEERALIKATIETLLLQVQPLPEDADTFMGEHEQTVVKAGYMVKEWAMQAFEEPDQSELDQPIS